jgi:hypothetical protein
MAYTLQKLNTVYNPYYGDLESLEPDELPVNSTIKPLTGEDKEDANLEIEKNEVVFLPTGELLKATGKTHAKGGSPVNLPDNSFIFSNYKPLAISKEDKEEFGFKCVGKHKYKNNTPAKIIGKEIDLEHHNRMIAIQESSKHDGISKKSSELMLAKNIKKAGQIAFLQEEKKGFPSGLPDFAQGTAPIKDPQIEQEEVMSKQFMQLGGPLLNRKNKPNIYDPSALMVGSDNWGTWPGDRLPIFKNQFGVSNAADKISDLDALSSQLGYNGAKDNLSFQNWLYNSSPENKAVIDKWHKTYGNPNIARPLSQRNMFDGKIGIRWTNAINEIKDRNPRIDVTPSSSPEPNYGPPTDPATTPTAVGNPYAAPANPALDTLPYDPYVPLTADQKLSLGVDAYNAASINKYAPKRAQTSFTPVTLERMNAQPYVNAINNQTQQAYKANQAMNPYIARASNSNTYGRGLEQISQTLGNVNNQNSQISNQENLYNNQGINRAENQNVIFDQDYYNKVQNLNQNYDNEQRFATNRLTDKFMQYRSQNDDLKFRLAAQPTFGSIDVYQNPKTGELSKTPKPGFIPRKQAAPLYDYNPYKNSIYYTGAGIDMHSMPNTATDYKSQLMQSLLQKYQSGNITEAELRTLAYISRGK